MRKYLIAAIACFCVAGFASLGFTADGDYVIPDGQEVADVEDAIIKIDYGGYLRYLRLKYENLQEKILTENEHIQNAIVARDSAIAAGTAAQDRKAAYVAERTALIAEYQAIRAAAEAAVTVTEGE